MRLACERQRRDLKRAEKSSFPYRFDIPAAERICRFEELSPHIKGKQFAGTLIRLEDWQCFVLTTVFGWLSKQTGLRRFRRAYSEIAKGNAKSTTSAPLCNYMGFAEGEAGAEVYAAATTRDQAKIVWSVAHAMLRKMPEFCRRAGVQTAAHSINQLQTNSFFRPLSSDAGGVEGINPYFICVDELHAHTSRDLYDNLDTANGKRQGSLLWVITTAGSDQAGICYEVRTYVTKILEGTVEDDSVFGIIYTIDNEDDWASGPDVWRKANPNWGVSVDPEDVAKKIHAALQIASKQPGVKTKHLNVWVNADHTWMDMVRWNKCATELNEEDFNGRPCIVCLDLASKLDLLAKGKLFWEDQDTEVTDPETGDKSTQLKRHYTFFGHYWTPDKRLEDTQNSQYSGWAAEGWLDTCPGETNNYDIVEDAIRQDCRACEVVEVAHDPYQAQQFVNHLQPEGITMVEVPQQAKYLSPAMEELEAAVYDGRFHFNGDPVLTWAISNVICHRDKNDLMFPNKPSFEKKIDPVTALLTGLNRAMAQDGGIGGGSGQSGVSVYGPCAKCGIICDGVMVQDKVVFDCGKHANG